MKFLDKLKREKPEVAVMFADVAGSTKLYDKLGDIKAQKKINSCIAMMSGFVQRNSGEVVKTIGDEIMCRFPTVDNACLACKNIQEYIEEKTQDNKSQLQIRMGMHFGEVLVKKADLFGDTINVAARMTEIAKARQIIVTKEVSERISSNIGVNTREFDLIKVKGKAEDTTIYEVFWEGGDLTVLSSPATGAKVGTKELVLSYGNAEEEIPSNTSGFLIGRGNRCDFIVNSNLASRIHASIEYHRGKFVLIDQSSNGTYIEDGNGKAVYLRREELPLVGEGSISLGEPVAKNKNHVIRYSCY